jgi:hypothetical protein
MANTGKSAVLIGLTPGERDAAAAVLRSFRGKGWVGGWERSKSVVDAIVDAVNQHRQRTEELT